MLQLASPTTAAARTVLRFALTEFLELAELDDEEEWVAREDRVSACFSRSLAISTVADMVEKLDLPETYQLGPYHELLLLTALTDWFSTVQDESRDFAEACFGKLERRDSVWLSVGEAGLLRLEPQSFLDVYVDDEDVLISAEAADRWSETDKERLGLRPGTWGVIRGLPPHPEELELRVVE